MVVNQPLMFPAPYFGGKSAIAHKVWEALGQPAHYIEPFCGSAAVLLARPDYDPQRHTETVVDADGHIANVWRSLQQCPDEVAKWCDWPVSHVDLSARKLRLLREQEALKERLIADDTFCNPRLAGYWIWAASCWIGSGLTCIHQRPNLSNAGQGVHKLSQIPHLSDAGKGVHRLGQRPHLSDAGQGVQEPYNTNLYTWFRQLSERLRYVRVVCGDWTRVCGGQWQGKMGTVGYFFDPPYAHAVGRDTKIYAEESPDVSAAVRRWAMARAENPNYRIVLAGYEGEHDELERIGWRVIAWKTHGGYANLGGTNENRKRERLWLSKFCVGQEAELFESA